MKRTIVFDQAFYDALGRLQLIARDSSGGRLEGARTSRRTGSGVEFADWRPYAPGDDAREIDFKALARLGRLFVKMRAREEASEVYLLVDATASMAFGRPTKFTFARRVAAALGAVALGGMDAVTVGFLRGRACELGERVTGNEGLVAVLRFLESADAAGETDVAEALASFLNAARAPGVVVVLSDFWSGSDVAGVLRHAAERGFEGTLVQTLTPEELAPEYGGRSRLVDGESGEEMELVLSAQTRQAYAEEIERFLAELRSAAERSGFRAARLSTESSLEDAVLGHMRAAGVVA